MSAFRDHCREIVDEYVQTVLIIDDGAGLKNSDETAQHIDTEGFKNTSIFEDVGDVGDVGNVGDVGDVGDVGM